VDIPYLLLMVFIPASQATSIYMYPGSEITHFNGYDQSTPTTIIQDGILIYPILITGFPAGGSLNGHSEYYEIRADVNPNADAVFTFGLLPMTFVMRTSRMAFIRSTSR
jgi:hypothetical protein